MKMSSAQAIQLITLIFNKLDSSLMNYLYKDLEPATSHYYAILCKESHLKPLSARKNYLFVLQLIYHKSH